MTDVEKFEQAEKVAEPKQFFGKRHVQYLLLFTVTALAYGLRNILNVAVIPMVESDPENGVKTYPEWSEQKNVMLSSFFWGYVLTQIPAGQIAEYFGPKRFLSGAMIICSLFSLLIPVLGEQWGVAGVILCRIIQGLMQGFIYPSVHHLISAWVPMCNRAKIAGFVYAGGPLGTVVVLPIAGFFSTSSYGWPAIFYTLGGIGFVWSAIWIVLGLDSPHQHKSIAEDELRYILDGIVTRKEEKVSTPWKEILTSLPFWAILICHFGDLWGFWTMLTEIPTYMDRIMGYDIKANSSLSALPYLAYCLISLVMSPLADYLIVNKYTSVGGSRKILNSIGVFIPAAALASLCFIGPEQRALTVVMLVVAVGFNSAILCGFHVNHIDIAPRHAGTLMGITNAIANVAAILAPLAVDVIKDAGGLTESDKSLWNVVFLVAAVLFSTTGLFYNFCGSGKVQPWNGPAEIKAQEAPEKEPMFDNHS